MIVFVQVGPHLFNLAHLVRVEERYDEADDLESVKTIFATPPSEQGLYSLELTSREGAALILFLTDTYKRHELYTMFEIENHIATYWLHLPKKEESE